MSFSNQVLQEYSMPYGHGGHFDKCYEGPVTYTAIPVIHPVEVDPHPAVIYTLYPSLPVGVSHNNSIVEGKNIFEIRNNSTYEVKSSDFNGPSSSTSSVENLSSKFNESITSIDCSPQNSTFENEESNVSSHLSSPSSDSIEGEGAIAQGNGIYGFFGVDGCWYPCSSDNSTLTVNESGGEEKSTNSFIQASVDCGDGLNPPTKFVMPKSLMSFYNCYQRLDLPSTALGRPQLIPTFSTDGNVSLAELWMAHMKLLFRNLPHKWTLCSSLIARSPDLIWHTFRDLAKVRFYCQRCMDGWTSMFGVVVFYYCWNPAMAYGEICYQISGQKCGKCNPSTFEAPLWYPEEAQKVITNLYYEIASRIYGLRTPQHIRTRRLGQPVNHHNKSLCQGCAHGLCKQDSQQLAEENPLAGEGCCRAVGYSTPNATPKQFDDKVNSSQDQCRTGVRNPPGENSPCLPCVVSHTPMPYTSPTTCYETSYPRFPYTTPEGACPSCDPSVVPFFYPCSNL